MLSSVLSTLRNTGMVSGGFQSARFYPTSSSKGIEVAESSTWLSFLVEVKVTKVVIKKHNVVLSRGDTRDDW